MKRGPVQIEYGPGRPRLHRRRRLQRWLVAAAVILVVSVALPKAWTAWNQVVLIYWQRQCLDYTFPANQPAAGLGTPTCYSRFIKAFGQGNTGTVLFLHERSDLFGPQLISVTLDATASLRDGHPVLNCDTFSPVSFRNNSRSWDKREAVCYMSPPQTQLFAGQVDPVHSDHFTIEYQVGEHRGTIDGWLLSYGAVLSVRPEEVEALKALKK